MDARRGSDVHKIQRCVSRARVISVVHSKIRQPTFSLDVSSYTRLLLQFAFSDVKVERTLVCSKLKINKTAGKLKFVIH